MYKKSLVSVHLNKKGYKKSGNKIIAKGQLIYTII